MGLNYLNLDQHTRLFMLEEIDLDVAADSYYKSQWLNANGLACWAEILRDAAANGNDDTLAQSIVQRNCLHTHYEKRKPKGGTTIAAIPYTAPVTMAEGEFNRYYVRGLCRRAIADGVPSLEVYRAKTVDVPRTSSEAMIGHLVDPAAILADLRTCQGLEPALGLPPGPNSGLCLKMPGR